MIVSMVWAPTACQVRHQTWWASFSSDPDSVVRRMSICVPILHLSKGSLQKTTWSYQLCGFQSSGPVGAVSGIHCGTCVMLCPWLWNNSVLIKVYGCIWGLSWWFSGSLPAYVGDVDLTPVSGRSPGEGNGNPLQYSCLRNPMDSRAWWATVHGVAKSQTQVSN